MSYSIKPILKDYVTEHGRQLVIQVIYQRRKVLVPTPFRLHDHEFDGKSVIAGKQKTAKNSWLLEKMNEIEGRLIDAMRKGEFNLAEVVKGEHGSPYFHTFIRTYAEEVKHRISPSLHAHHLNLADTVETFRKVFLYEVDHVFLLKLEKHLYEENDHNTVHKKMKNYKKILKEAKDRDLIKESQYKRYKIPLYKQGIPEFLNLEEMKTFKGRCDMLPDELKVCGYYFLLSCFTGYRLKDSTGFNYKHRVKGNQIILKAKKNGQIVSMPIYPILADVLAYVKNTPITYTEQYIRKVVYNIAKTAGVDRKINFHTSRHSFAMMLIDHDFSIDEIAELMGISVKTARIYARVTNKRLSEKVTDKLGNINGEKT